MTKTIEIYDILQPSQELIPNLWGRFNKVRQVIIDSLLANQSSEITREFNTFSWTGYDEGIHDHSGSLNGTAHNIRISMQIKGTTIEQEKLNEEFRLNKQTHTQIKISGNFVSVDGKEGAIEMALENGAFSYEAYWLSCLDGYLRLEQIVDSHGEVFDINNLSLDYQRKAIIPGTRHSLTTQKEKTINIIRTFRVRSCRSSSEIPL